MRRYSEWAVVTLRRNFSSHKFRPPASLPLRDTNFHNEGKPLIGRSRKRPLGFVSEEYAREQWQLITSLKLRDLIDPRKKTRLPYPGLGSVCPRPPVFLQFVGRNRLHGLLYDWIEENSRKVIICGCKGIGKSTEFRALACILYMMYKDEGKKKVVFLWGQTLLEDPVGSVKNALLFCFLGNVDDGYEEWQQVKAAIENICSLEMAASFIDQRKQDQNEKFYFLVDGGEMLDALDVLGKPVYNAAERSAAKKDLKQLWNAGARVWWCKSDLVLKESFFDAPCIKIKNASFTEGEYDTYASDSFLCHLKRWDDIIAYTGLVPLFLDALSYCCCQFAKAMRKSESQEQALSARNNEEFLKVMVAVRDPTDDEIVDLLKEDEYWDMVLSMFTEHSDVKMVHLKAAAIQLPKDWNLRRSIEIDPTYVTDGEYCSSYVRKVYTEALLSKEEQQKPYADGAWMDYTRWLLADTKEKLNWSTLGWLCESLLASVIPKKGLKLGEKVNVLGEIPVSPFNKIPSCRIKDLLGKPSGWRRYFKPEEVSFPHVDALVICVDNNQTLHLVFLQYTVNVDGHLDSAKQFMNLLYLRLWFPDLEEYVARDEAISQDDAISQDVSTRGRGTGSGSHIVSSSNSSSKVKLHFAFLGCSFVPGYNSGLRPASLRSGIPEYELHIQPFDNSIPGLSPDDYQMLDKIARHRIWRKNYVDVCPNGVGLLALTRSELEKMATKYGIQDPSSRSYKTKSVLINAICAIVNAPITSASP